MATQNPIESEGTYPLPEAQIDRFMLKVLVDYPAHDDELTVVQRSLVAAAGAAPDAHRSTTCWRSSGGVAAVYVDPALVSYAVAVADATRGPRTHGLPELADYVAYGASPRGPISLVAGGRALALHARPRLRRRAATSSSSRRTRSATGSCSRYQALAEEVTPDTILDHVLATVPMPQIDLGRRAGARDVRRARRAGRATPARPGPGRCPARCCARST